MHIYLPVLQCSFVWQVFKEPLECPTLRGGPILSPEDVKGIFGNVTDILDVHKQIQVRTSEIKLILYQLFTAVTRNP